jgi:hypothetical protein
VVLRRLHRTHRSVDSEMRGAMRGGGWVRGGEGGRWVCASVRGGGAGGGSGWFFGVGWGLGVGVWGGGGLQVCVGAGEGMWVGLRPQSPLVSTTGDAAPTNPGPWCHTGVTAR